VTTENRGVLVAAMGALALQFSLTDAILEFLRPGMRRWLFLAGVTMLILGAMVLIGARRTRGQEPAPHGHLRVGWLLLVPLCVGVLAPQALGSYAAERAASWRTLTPRAFDLDAYLRAHALGSGTPTLRVIDYVNATVTPRHRAYLETHPVRLLGLVVTNDQRPGTGFFLTRFIIGCCAADAIPVRVDVIADGHGLPKPNTWVEATVRLDPERPSVDESVPPVAHLVTLRKSEKPSSPYEYPS
jgi:uncharacterized repeat protein (TIGR03943 family)